MRSLKEISQDMRGLAALLTQAADELDAAAGIMTGLFGGGPAEAAPFEPSRKTLNPAELTQLRQLWNETPPEFQTTERKQELAKQFGITTRAVQAILISVRKTASNGC